MPSSAACFIITWDYLIQSNGKRALSCDPQLKSLRAHCLPWQIQSCGALWPCCLLLERARVGRACCICSICKCCNKLFKALSTGPSRACLPLRSSTFPAHQMDAPLLETLEGSGVFCFNWRARADSYGAIFIREGLERESAGTALQIQPWILNIKQLQLSDQLFFFSAGKVDEICAR